MQNCKKYKPSPAWAGSLARVDHHRRPKADCKGCVYFSKMNCRMHGQPVDESIVFGYNE